MTAIKKTFTASLTEQRSKFHALLAPASGEEQIKQLLAQRKKAFRKARHHCWAARLEVEGKLVEMAHNDGEVGKPGQRLLALLQRNDLQGALVVSRIFGGVKLGPAGVGRAFSQVGQLVVEQAIE